MTTKTYLLTILFVYIISVMIPMIWIKFIHVRKLAKTKSLTPDALKTVKMYCTIAVSPIANTIWGTILMLLTGVMIVVGLLKGIDKLINFIISASINFLYNISVGNSVKKVQVKKQD